MTDETTEQTSPADGPSQPRPATLVERPLLRRAAARNGASGEAPGVRSGRGTSSRDHGGRAGAGGHV